MDVDVDSDARSTKKEEGGERKKKRVCACACSEVRECKGRRESDEKRALREARREEKRDRGKEKDNADGVGYLYRRVHTDGR